MSIIQLNGVCPAILVGIGDILNTNDPKNLITPVGLAQALLDPSNRQPNSVVQNVDAGAGHPKTVRIMRKQRGTDADTATSKSCDEGAERPYMEDVFTVNQYRQQTHKFSEATIRKLCDSYSSYMKLKVQGKETSGAAYDSIKVMREFAEQIQLDSDGLRIAINKDLLTSFALNYGRYTDNSYSKTFNMYRSNDASGLPVGSPVLDGFNKFKREVSRSTFNGLPIVFGEGLLDLAVASLQYGCCNMGGTDFGAMANSPGFKFYKDFFAGSALGNADAFGAFMPGTMQLATYNEYVGSFGDIGKMSRGVMPDTKLPGIQYDVRVLPNECGEYYNVFIGLHFDLYVAPTNQFQASDRLAGVNGVFKGIAGGL